MERLREDLATARRFRHEILREVQRGEMPPGEAGRAVVEASPRYRDLPALDEPAGREILRNWLACDLPIVERTADDRPPGEEPIGAIVPPRPGGGVVCGPGLADCGGLCVATASDPQHCGGCDVVCAPEQVCAGSCTSACPGATTVCGRSCVDTNTSPLHCGDCDRSCPAGSVCSAGECGCEGGGSLCSGGCVDTAESRAHCGRCDNPCGAGQSCAGGACTACGSIVSFSGDVVTIFTQRCSDGMCHSGRRPAAGMDLSSAAAAHASLVGVPGDCSDGRLRVAPGDPDRSYLIDKLRGRNLCRGVQMPNRGEALPESQILLIEDWICGGARND
jgi:hypothetical protein